MPFSFLPAMYYKGSVLSASLPIPGIICLFDYSHPSGCGVVTRCGFNLMLSISPIRFLAVTS